MIYNGKPIKMTEHIRNTLVFLLVLHIQLNMNGRPSLLRGKMILFSVIECKKIAVKNNGFSSMMENL